MFTIRLNGEAKQLAHAMCLTDLLKTLDVEATNFAVAINQVFIPRSHYAETILNEHDEVDIVVAMQGG